MRHGIEQKKQSSQRASILIQALVFAAVATLFIGGLIGRTVMSLKTARHILNREQAIQIAEGGIDYYRWHLAHSPNDFKDGTCEPGPCQSGPYVHNFKDKNGTVIGQYSLEIVEPAIGSTIVDITSTGWLNSDPSNKRSIRARLGMPSFVSYSFLINTDAWFGPMENTHGKLHSNEGLAIDGTNDSAVTATKENYQCHAACNPNNPESKPGIWGDGGPSSFWSFPVNSVLFNKITEILSNIYNHANSDGIYLAPSGEKGYYLHFNSDRTVDIYKVKQLRGTTGYYYNENWQWKSDTKNYDIQTPIAPPNVAIVQMARPIPASGIIFVEDHVWVDGVISGRITVGSGIIGGTQSKWTTAVINGNITYTVKDGTDAFGLIAQKNVLVPYYAPNNLEINGALIAQNGSVMRYFYPSNILDGTITVYGAIITSNMWTWNWGDPVSSGYKYTNTTYDSYLLNNPPPDMPVSEEKYDVLSWEEF